MRKINVVLDDELVEQCRQETGIQTVSALIDHALRKLLRHERQKKVLELKGNIRREDNLKKRRRTVKILARETSASDLDYWIKKTPEERLSAVELLREQFYAIQGYRRIPRIKRIVHKVEMDE